MATTPVHEVVFTDRMLALAGDLPAASRETFARVLLRLEPAAGPVAIAVDPGPLAPSAGILGALEQSAPSSGALSTEALDPMRPASIRPSLRTVDAAVRLDVEVSGDLDADRVARRMQEGLPRLLRCAPGPEHPSLSLTLGNDFAHGMPTRQPSVDSDVPVPERTWSCASSWFGEQRAGGVGRVRVSVLFDAIDPPIPLPTRVRLVDVEAAGKRDRKRVEQAAGAALELAQSCASKVDDEATGTVSFRVVLSPKGFTQTVHLVESSTDDGFRTCLSGALRRSAFDEHTEEVGGVVTFALDVGRDPYFER